MAQNWIQHCSKQESLEFAIQIIGYGYIPWSPYGGRHIMDDFGNLVIALPFHYYQDRMWLSDYISDSTGDYYGN